MVVNNLLIRFQVRGHGVDRICPTHFSMMARKISDNLKSKQKETQHERDSDGLDASVGMLADGNGAFPT